VSVVKAGEHLKNAQRAAAVVLRNGLEHEQLLPCWSGELRAAGNSVLEAVHVSIVLEVSENG
jgi:hypothetical protein